MPEEVPYHVDVELSDAQGRTLVTTTAQGPFFMTRLRAGAHDPIASINGQTAQRRMVVNPGAAAATDATLRVPVGRWRQRFAK